MTSCQKVVYRQTWHQDILHEDVARYTGVENDPGKPFRYITCGPGPLLWQCPGGEILPIRIKLVILRNNSVSLVECRVINSGSEIPCHKLASISTKFRVINFMTRDSRHGIKILWKFSKKSLHRGFWGEKIKLSKNPCMGTLRGHIRRCSCKGDNFFWKLLPKTLGVRFLHNKIVLGILEIFFVLRIFFWK